MNRFLRRMQRFGKSFSARRSQAEMTNKQAELFEAKTPADVTSTRAKSERHGKVTADKWNQ
jgi:DNA primase